MEESNVTSIEINNVEERNKNSDYFLFTVGKIIEGEQKNLGLSVDKEAIAFVSDVCFEYAREILPKELELFSKHAKRKVIGDDE